MSVLTDPKAGEPAAGSGDSGNQSPADWRTGLPEELRGDKSLESIKGKDWAEAGPVLVKNYIHAQSLVGADKLIIPGKDAKPEVIAEFRRKLGVPEKAEEYGVKLPEGITEDKIDKKLLDVWKGRLHAQGIPKAQAESIITEYLSDNAALIKTQEEASVKQQETWASELLQKFGKDYDKQVNFARFALKELGSTELATMLEQSGLGSNPSVVEFFAKAGKAISDDKALGSGGLEGRPTSSAGAQHALNAFNQDPAKQEALWKREHPNHDAAVKERDELFKLAFQAV